MHVTKSIMKSRHFSFVCLFTILLNPPVHYYVVRRDRTNNMGNSNPVAQQEHHDFVRCTTMVFSTPYNACAEHLASKRSPWRGAGNSLSWYPRTQVTLLDYSGQKKIVDLRDYENACYYLFNSWHCILVTYLILPIQTEYKNAPLYFEIQSCVLAGTLWHCCDYLWGHAPRARLCSVAENGSTRCGQNSPFHAGSSVPTTKITIGVLSLSFLRTMQTMLDAFSLDSLGHYLENSSDLICIILRERYRHRLKCWPRSGQAKTQALFGMLAEDLRENHVDDILRGICVISWKRHGQNLRSSWHLFHDKTMTAHGMIFQIWCG